MRFFYILGFRLSLVSGRVALEDVPILPRAGGPGFRW